MSCNGIIFKRVDDIIEEDERRVCVAARCDDDRVGLVCQPSLGEDGDVVLERVALGGDVLERADLFAVDGEGEARERRRELDCVGKGVVHVHGGAGELGSDDSVLRIARGVGRVVPGALEGLTGVEMDEATGAGRALLP